VMNVANGYWLPLLRAAGIPSLVNVDGIEWERAKWGRLAKTMFRTGAKWTARWGTDLVFDAKAIQQRWGREFKRGGKFIPYGGDVQDQLPLEPGLRHRGYVLMVARFVPENTVPEFIDATEKLSADYDVVIVGSSGYGGELEERVATLASRTTRVQWMGHIADDARLFSLWQHAGAYYHGHSVGGTNPALVQAMACGAPIVARDTAYNREVLGDDIPLTRPTADAILVDVRGLMENAAEQDRRSAIGLERAVQEYAWNNICSSYGAALGEMTGDDLSSTNSQRFRWSLTRPYADAGRSAKS
jgi:glycosyltransferase involved in cell wall biosynthesis